MSAFIGSVNGPAHEVAVEVLCSLNAVELCVAGRSSVLDLDPIAARNLAALLVRAAEESEMMRFRERVTEAENRTPLRPGEEA